MSSKNKKKLKMERLSPITPLERCHLPLDSQHTPVRPGVPTSRRKKDAYAIEATSSPEFGQLPSTAGPTNLQKPRKYRTIARHRASRKPSSTPLSGLISKRTVLATPHETFPVPHSSPTSKDFPSHYDGDSASAPSEPPQIDDYSPSKPPHSPRHSEIISATTVFPPKPQPGSSTTPLAGIVVNKKASNLNRSLNDSIAVLLEAEDLSGDEEICSPTTLVPLESNTEKISIECFESPRKPQYALSKGLITSAGIFKNFHPHPQKTLPKDNLESSILNTPSSNHVEMCGNERKNRKRALDFNSSAFVVNTYEAVHHGHLSRVLNLGSRRRDCRSPTPKLTSPYRELENDLQSPMQGSVCVNRNPGGRSPTAKLIPGRELEDDLMPIVRSRTDLDWSQDQKRSFSKVQENLKSPLLETVAVSRNPGQDLHSPVLQFKCANRDFARKGRSLTPELTSSSHELENCQSSILETTTFNQNPEQVRYSPIHNRDFARKGRSPTPELPSPSHENCQSSILVTTTFNRNPEQVRHSPIHNRDFARKDRSPTPKLTSPSHELEDSQPRISNHSFFNPDCEPPFRFMEAPSEAPEVKPTDECLSDCDSIIESTPRLSKNIDYDSGGFTASSCLKIDNDSPPCDTDDRVVIPEIEAFEETLSKYDEKRDLKLVVVSHDTSDESEPDVEHTKCCGMFFPTIEGRHSPVELNFTKRPIQSFESPSKAAKPFSEAVNIGMFGSPDSNTSLQDQYNEEEEKEQEEEGTNEEVIEPSTTQEYVEESEQVRPTKRRKKGSLLERVRNVIAKVDASNALFDYEIKCGLRPVKGKLVSAALVVLNNPSETSSLFLVCKPVKYCQNPPHTEDLSSFVLVHVNKLPSGVTAGSIFVLHFPLNVIYVSDLYVPCVLAGHRIVSCPTEQKIDVSTIDASPLESINSLCSPYSKPITSFRTFSSGIVRTLNEAALCQNLIEECNLYLTVMHITKLWESGIVKKILVLCCDEELLPCWLEFSSERDIKRAAALETLNVLSDGSPVQTKGFSVIGRFPLDRKSKNLVSYCSNNTVSNEIAFSVRPKETNWVISSTDGEIGTRKVSVSVGSVLSERKSGCRYLLEVRGVETDPKITLRDSEGRTIDLVVGEHSSVHLEHPVPFLLDGVYFYEGRLFSDEHTRVVPNIPS